MHLVIIFKIKGFCLKVALCRETIVTWSAELMQFISCVKLGFFNKFNF